MCDRVVLCSQLRITRRYLKCFVNTCDADSYFFVLLLFSFNVLNAPSLKCISVILRLVDAKVFNVETSHANECNEVRD